MAEQRKKMTAGSVQRLLLDLEQTLSSFDAAARVDWRVGQLANALLAQVRELASDHPLVSAVEDFRAERGLVVATHAGTMRAVLRQLALVFET